MNDQTNADYEKKIMQKIELRARVREVMVEAMENLDKFTDLNFFVIALHIQNHLTNKGFEVVEKNSKPVADFLKATHDKTAMLTAVEYGYKLCEKGHNIQRSLEKGR